MRPEEEFGSPVGHREPPDMFERAEVTDSYVDRVRLVRLIEQHRL